jgi:hypothetical protein
VLGPNSGYLGDLLTAEAAGETMFENGGLTRSANSPCIFYWKGALNTLSFSTDGLYRIVSGPHPSSSDFSEARFFCVSVAVLMFFVVPFSCLLVSF